MEILTKQSDRGFVGQEIDLQMDQTSQLVVHRAKWLATEGCPKNLALVGHLDRAGEGQKAMLVKGVQVHYYGHQIYPSFDDRFVVDYPGIHHLGSAVVLGRHWLNKELFVYHHLQSHSGRRGAPPFLMSSENFSTAYHSQAVDCLVFVAGRQCSDDVYDHGTILVDS